MMNDPDFEAAAVAEFIRVMGESTLETYRELVGLMGGLAASQAAAWLNLSENDREIFRAVASKLHREGARRVSPLEAFPDIHRMDPLDRRCQDRAHAYIVNHGGQKVYDRIRAAVIRDGGPMKVMLDAIEDARGDYSMILTWCLATKAARELRESN